MALSLCMVDSCERRGWIPSHQRHTAKSSPSWTNQIENHADGPGGLEEDSQFFADLETPAHWSPKPSGAVDTQLNSTSRENRKVKEIRLRMLRTQYYALP